MSDEDNWTPVASRNPSITSNLPWLGGGLDLLNTATNIWALEENRRRYREGLHREDTAVQRRVADLKAAGINPILAAGQAATTMSPMQAEGSVAKLEESQRMLSMAQQQAQISLTKAEQGRIAAETRYLNEQTFGQNLTNKYNQDANPSRLEILRLEADLNADMNPWRIHAAQQEAEHRDLTNTAISLDNSLRRLNIERGQIQRGIERIEYALKHYYSFSDAAARNQALWWTAQAAELQVMQMEWNQSYAESHGRPVGQTHTGLSGQLFGIADAIIGAGR